MENISTTLFTVLETLGYTSDYRKLCVDVADTCDVVNNLTRRYKFTSDPTYGVLYRCAGSQVDGTCRPSLHSDRDFLFINQILTVGEIEDNDVSYHMIYMENYPGYILMRENTNNLHVPTISENNNEVFKPVTGNTGHVFLTNWPTPLDKEYERSGPSFKIKQLKLQGAGCDIVYAFQSTAWPQIADGWFKRERKHSWPSKETIEEFHAMPCLLVPVGHPHCTTNRNQHWRLSFSLQERHLMVNLTDVQYKCYVLLKMIKEGIITPKLGKNLTSYHCKTSLFYTIEENDQSIWRPENLLECVRKCLQRLLTWVEIGFCPNYFLPSSNLFLGKVEDEKLDQLILILTDVVRCLAEYIARLRIENIAEWVQSIRNNDTHTKNRLMDEADRSFADTVLKLLGYTVIDAFDLYSEFLVMESSTYQRIVVLNLLAQSPYSGKEETINYTFGCLYANIASELVSKALQTTGLDRIWYIGAAVYHFMRALAMEDKISKLKLANVLIATGHRRSAAKILRNMEKDIMKVCVHVGFEKCKCDLNPEDIRINELTKNILRFPLSLLLKRFTCGPVVFRPTELAVIPHELVFEMFRTVATPTGLQEWCAQHRRLVHYNLVTIDAVNMFYLLKYHAGMYKNFKDCYVCICKSAIDVTTHTLSLQNALSWMARKAGDYGLSALWCLISWVEHFSVLDVFSGIYKIPDGLSACNAAKLHMTVLAYELWKHKAKMEQANTQIKQLEQIVNQVYADSQ